MAITQRIFIVCNSNYPRGSALANYVQYLVSACVMSGYDVVLISNVNKEYIYNRQTKEDYEKLHFTIEPFSISELSVIRHYQYKYNFDFQKINLLKRHRVKKNDCIIILSPNVSLCKKIIKMRRSLGFKIIAPVLEMFDEINYGESEQQFKLYTKVVSTLLPQFDMILPISTFIEDYYKKKGCRTFCLPIMADCQEYPLKTKENDKYRFVLPANGKMKDDLSSMLGGFALLSPEQLSKIEIHICGVKEDKVRLSLSESEYQKIESALTIHKWMKYDELIALYQRMHFLILSRASNQMTMANFPSKVPETMGFGIVPVCSDVGDYTKYYLQNGVDSLFIDGSSPEACFQAISKAIGLPWERFQEMSNNARRTVELRFDYRVWAPKIKEVLESL